MLRNLTANLVLHERIETTDAKAKELRRVAERLITKARRLGEVAYTPQTSCRASDKARGLPLHRIVAAYIPRFGVRVENGRRRRRRSISSRRSCSISRSASQDRAGGYTRIMKFGPRRGDNAPISLIEFVEQGGDEAEPEKKGGAKAKTKSSKKATAVASAEGAKVE